jgi:polyisoprenoid-binding protein YceI
VTRFRIDSERSQLWTYARSTLHPIDASVRGLEGHLELAVKSDGRIDLDAPQAGRVELPVRRLRSGNPLEDREMQRRIDARKYPTIAGVLTEIRDGDGEGEGNYRVRGDLTFRGVTRTYEDTMTVNALDPDTIQLEGESTFDVRDHGMEPPRILMLKVEPHVRVRVSIVAVRDVDS